MASDWHIKTSMSEKPKHIQLVIDANNKTTRLESVEPKVVEIDQEQIVAIDTKIALNGGYSVTISYRNGQSDILVFQDKKELLTALANILRE